MNDILVKIGADISNFAKGIKETQDKLSSFGKSAKNNELTIGKLAAAAGITTLAFKAIGMAKDSVSRAFGRIDTMEQFERVMTTMTGSSEKAQTVLDNVNETVKGTAYGLDIGAKAVQGFVTSNMDVDKATTTFKAWGDAVAFYGDGTSETLGSVTDALAKATAKGKVQMDTMNRLAEAGVPAMQIYADATGQSVEEVAEQMQKGQLKADEFVNVMNVAMANGTKNFKSIDGAAKDAGASWSGSFDNMKAAVARGTIAIIHNIDKMLKDNGLPDMREMIANFGKKFEEVLKKIADAIPPTVEKLKALKEMLEPWLPIITPIIAALGAFIGAVAGLNSVIKIAQGVWAAFNFVLGANPFVLIAAGIVVLIAALVLAYKKVEWFRDMVDAAWAWIKDAFGAALAWIKDIAVKVMSEVSAFFGEQLAEIKAFWDENGAQIMAIVKAVMYNVWEVIKAVMGVIKGIFQAVWPIISGVVVIAWNMIKGAVRNGIDLVLGIIRTVMALLRGDWEGAWTAIKETAQKIWTNIQKFFTDVDLYQIGKDIINGLIKGIGSMVSAVGKAVKNIGTKIKDTFTGFFQVKSPSRLMMSIAKHLPGGIIKGLDGMHGKLKVATARMSEALVPDVPAVTMAYATPSGSYDSLSGAVNGSVDVNASNDMLAGAIASLERKLTDLRVEMDGREVGHIVAPTVSEALGRQSTQITRGRGQRRI